MRPPPVMQSLMALLSVSDLPDGLSKKLMAKGAPPSVSESIPQRSTKSLVFALLCVTAKLL